MDSIKTEATTKKEKITETGIIIGMTKTNVSTINVGFIIMNTIGLNDQINIEKRQQSTERLT